MIRKCPVCSKDHEVMKRYPLAVCNRCLQKYTTLTKDSKNIDFFNIDAFGGGIKSIVDGKLSSETECYINGVKCYADEARFGGIVIQRLIE